MTYFGGKPYILQIAHDGDWFTSDDFHTIDEACTIAEKKVTPWRIIRRSTGATVCCGNPVWVTTAAPKDEMGVLEWNYWLHHASILQLQVQAALLESVIAAYAVMWEEVDGDGREICEARLLFYDTQLSDVQITIHKRLQPQYVAQCEN